MSTELRRDTSPTSKEYNVLSVETEKGSWQDGWYACAEEVVEKIKNHKTFITKHDALIFADSVRNLMFRLQTRPHVPLTKVETRLRGNDKDGYTIEFNNKYNTF